jgi:hypothetical protein
MIKKFHILLIILTLGIFLTPSQTYACGTKSAKTEKSCCKKQKTEKKKCCSKDTTTNQKDQNGCDGNCGHSSCNCPTFCFSLAMPFFVELNNNNFGFDTQKQKFYDLETYLSSGFLSIWTPPPNIS